MDEIKRAIREYGKSAQFPGWWFAHPGIGRPGFEPVGEVNGVTVSCRLMTRSEKSIFGKPEDEMWHIYSARD